MSEYCEWKSNHEDENFPTKEETDDILLKAGYDPLILHFNSHKFGRLLRLAVVRNLLGSGNLTRDEATLILKGSSNFNVDDSDLIDISNYEEAKIKIFGDEK